MCSKIGAVTALLRDSTPPQLLLHAQQYVVDDCIVICIHNTQHPPLSDRLRTPTAARAVAGRNQTLLLTSKAGVQAGRVRWKMVASLKHMLTSCQ